MASDEVKNENTEEEEKETGLEMSFLDHLEELRWRVIYSLIGLVVGTGISWFFIDFLVDKILLKPARDSGAVLQNLRPFGQLFMYMEVAVIAGVILSLPNIFYQFWKFLSPALRKRERRYIWWIVIFSTLCFLIGVVFAYYLMIPLSLKFAVQFGSEAIKNQFSIDEYLSIIISIVMGAGIVFELPMISFFLTKLGILTPGFMRKFRRHAVVVIFILSAVLSPGTDPVLQLMLAAPLFVLYEISILISKIASKKN